MRLSSLTKKLTAGKHSHRKGGEKKEVKREVIFKDCKRHQPDCRYFREHMGISRNNDDETV
jgi:hypothetical protein